MFEMAVSGIVMMLEEGYDPEDTEDWRIATMGELAQLLQRDYFPNYIPIIHHWDGDMPEVDDDVPRLGPAIDAHKYDAPCIYFIYGSLKRKNAVEFKYPFDMNDGL